MSNILVIEDEFDIATLYKICLEVEGYNVDIYNGTFNHIMSEDVFDKYQTVITDLMLPGISGKEIIGFIKGLNPNIRVVVVTAALNLIDESLLTHADMVLSKPFRPLDLIVAVQGKNLTEGNGATVLRRTMHRYIWEGNKHGDGKTGTRIS